MSEPKETVTFWEDGKLVEREVDATAFDAMAALRLEPIKKHGPDVKSRRLRQRAALLEIIIENPDLVANPAELARLMVAKGHVTATPDELDKNPAMKGRVTASADYKSLELIIRRAMERYYEKSK
jgi:hypothetical protein